MSHHYLPTFSFFPRVREDPMKKKHVFSGRSPAEKDYNFT